MSERGHAGNEARLAVEGDAGRIARAFEAEEAGIPIDQVARYVAEQAAGTRLVLMAEREGAAAGYLTLSWTADYPPFQRASIPEIQDLNVVPSRRRQGVATLLLDRAEALAARRGAAAIGLNVGLYEAYGPAQRLYVLRGYVPDGAGATTSGRPLLGGESVPVDDSLVLHLLKTLG